MSSFTEVERDILANLEESGEDDVAALINTLRLHEGSVQEIEAFRTAMTSLINRDALQLARLRDQRSRHWTPLPKQESVALITNLSSLLSWSGADKLWKWTDDLFRVEVVLTNAGSVAAQEILSQHGWPRRRDLPRC